MTNKRIIRIKKQLQTLIEGTSKCFKSRADNPDEGTVFISGMGPSVITEYTHQPDLKIESFRTQDSFGFYLSFSSQALDGIFDYVTIYLDSSFDENESKDESVITETVWSEINKIIIFKINPQIHTKNKQVRVTGVKNEQSI
jgi:hypothetical protein